MSEGGLPYPAWSLRKSRSMTALGSHQFEDHIRTYIQHLEKTKGDIDNLCVHIESEPLSLSDVGDTQVKLQQHYDDYMHTEGQYCKYLRAQRSVEAMERESVQRAKTEEVSARVTRIMDLLKSIIPVKSTIRQRSVVSSRSSHNSAHLSYLLKHSQRLATAKARLKFAEAEATIIKQEAELKASRKILDIKRELEEAKCNLEAVYDNMTDQDEGSVRSLVRSRRVESYVQSVNDLFGVKQSDAFCEKQVSGQPYRHTTSNLSANAVPFVPAAHNVSPGATSAQNHNLNTQPDNSHTESVLVNRTDTSMCDQFAKVFAKKNLISKKHVFDDNPQNYAMWKASFKNAVRELDLSIMEEMDLLIQWLGDTSSATQARSIRNANASNTKKGLERIWERLEDRFASPEVVESAIKSKIMNFPKLTNKDNAKLYELYDIVMEIQAFKENPFYSTLFSYYDSSSGVNPIVAKLPFSIQERWVTEATKHKQHSGSAFPAFSVFAAFLKRMAKMKNDPSFQFDSSKDVNNNTRDVKGAARSKQILHPQLVKVQKTELGQQSNDTGSGRTGKQNSNVTYNCPLHADAKHNLNDCRLFRSKPMDERKRYLRENGYCFNCCGPKKHMKARCRETVRCSICNSSDHPTALHNEESTSPKEMHEGEKRKEPVNMVNNKCTQICGDLQNTTGSKSCAKIVKAIVYPEGRRELAKYIYCIIDDQSNHTLAVSNFFNSFGENGPDITYPLATCSGQSFTSGRKAHGYMIESLDGSYTFELPDILECNDIPQNRSEIPVPHIAFHFPHLKDIAEFIPPIDNNVAIEMLLGRDLIDAHIVRDQRVGERGAPIAQLLPLGWAIIGNTCLGNAHGQTVVNVNKISVMPNGRPTYFEPCDSSFCVKDDPVFSRTTYDETQGLSVEDQAFFDIMDSGFRMSDSGKWTAPLPFRAPRPQLHDNRDAALKRAISFDTSLKHNASKAAHVCEFMQKIFDKQHAELAPQIDKNKERWYLPLFSVYHPKKPDNLRVVFDSSAKFYDVSLNDVLLKGPPLYNSLLGILLRFRREAIAVIADVEQMFHNFHVHEEHRDYLRFLWHEGNDITKPLTDHRMTVHAFGNKPSPAVASYGLRRAVDSADLDVKDFVHSNFYVDDALVSCDTQEQAVNLIKRTQATLQKNGRLRLHKIASNSRSVLDSFPQADLAKDLCNLDLCTDTLPTQRSLGLLWDIESDHFIFRTSQEVKPFTKRGILSVINGLYDPIGFSAPVVLTGKLLMKDMLSVTTSQSWDENLPESFRKPWMRWMSSLSFLEQLRVPRKYSHTSFENAAKRIVHVFCDASKDAIGVVAYIQLYNSADSEPTLSFLLGKSKVAPIGGNTIPRMELCAAVLGIEVANIVKEQLRIDTDCFRFYTDSQIVLGYITNTSRRFYVYVGNRVNRIRSFSSTTQWSYIATKYNPADLATRPMDSAHLKDSMWLVGPPLNLLHEDSLQDTYPLIDPQNDQEVCPELAVHCDKAVVYEEQHTFYNIGSERFFRFSTWESVVRAITYLKRYLLNRSKSEMRCATELYEDAELFLIKVTQIEAYGDAIQCIQNGSPLQKGHSMLSLSPIIDEKGILRVGGRLDKVKGDNHLSLSEQHPIIMPKSHHISRLLIRRFHQQVSHQGRLITEGAIRTGGFWVVGMRRLVRSEISKCVTCRKLRGSLGWHRMSDLPDDRIEPSPPFSFVGVDTFGPWQITQRRTRGHTFNSMRWALMFTCLVSRAVHLEVIEELSAASFINALRRFISIRGPVKQFRSDRGTNFIGAVNELNIPANFVENPMTEKFLKENRMVWLFNPPHASHHGGAWERMIGVARRILDALMLNHKGSLTHEVLTTFLMEVSAIINARPLVPISADPERPEALTPSHLIHQKSSCANIAIPDNIGSKDAIKSAWKRVQYMANLFWQRWRSEYLQNLQVRSKWLTEGEQFKQGDVVLLKDDSLARYQWPLAIIIDTFESSDGRIREVKVRCGRTGTSYVRPITQLCRLVEVD